MNIIAPLLIIANSDLTPSEMLACLIVAIILALPIVFFDEIKETIENTIYEVKEVKRKREHPTKIVTEKEYKAIIKEWGRQRRSGLQEIKKRRSLKSDRFSITPVY